MQDSPDIGKVVLVGPSGTQCGLAASFTQHLADALRHRHPSTRILIAATTIARHAAQPPAMYCAELVVEDRKGYAENARYLSSPALGIDVVSLQHHYRLFGGRDGDFILSFLAELAIPVVTTMHHVPPNPSLHLVQTTEQLLNHSDRVVVTNREDRIVLGARYGADPRRIDVIPLPDSPGRFRNQVASEMVDRPAGREPDRRATRPAAWAGEEDWLWEAVAELYNQSFVRTIIGARPAKQRRRCQPWPWVHRREFAVSSGTTPGWDW